MSRVRTIDDMYWLIYIKFTSTSDNLPHNECSQIILTWSGTGHRHITFNMRKYTI